VTRVKYRPTYRAASLQAIARVPEWLPSRGSTSDHLPDDENAGVGPRASGTFVGIIAGIENAQTVRRRLKLRIN
jgi:hypothetical protein